MKYQSNVAAPNPAKNDFAIMTPYSKPGGAQFVIAKPINAKLPAGIIPTMPPSKIPLVLSDLKRVKNNPIVSTAIETQPTGQSATNSRNKMNVNGIGNTRLNASEFYTLSVRLEAVVSAA
jgi:hypothetical protein